ncbi:plasma-membrane choline transporter-domain-containing protein [Phellopilus nigrolimitatus]|nr:plasma-membrane choline transporter-domain-containing protein [Phellopilus nigrolimitatus]
MTASFATYASQFLTRQQQPSSSAASTSQPLFYSFTTDNGSHAGDTPHAQDDAELDDDDDPHLGRSSDYLSRRTEIPPDDDDPYLRLDEDDPPLSRTAHYNTDTLPLIASESANKPVASEPVQGWLAHQAPLSYRVTPSPPSDSSSDSGVPPPDLLISATRPARTAQNWQENQLTESLLPRDGVTRPVDVFSLPDPRPHSRGRVIHKDYHWTAAWLGSVTACVIGSFIILFTTSSPRSAPRGTVLPYTTLLHTIPLLTILTFLSASVSYVHIMLLRIFVKPVMFATSVFIPVALFISAIWAFVGSFMWEEGIEPSWGETVGLRLFSLIPLILAIFTARRLMHLQEELHTTSAILTLSTSLLISNPFLLALSPLLLLLALLGSIPFLTLSFRLLLIGYSTAAAGSTWEWHVKSWAGWAIVGTVSVWLWSWGVVRGILRTTCAAVIGAWYFSPLESPVPPPFDTFRIHAALYRSADTSLGSVALSALLLTGVRILTLTAGLLRRAPMPLLPWLTLPLNMLGNMTGALSTLALVYTGLTGDAFFPSARRARVLTAAVMNSSGKVKYRRTGIDPSLAILTITPLTLTLPFALSAYLFVAHTLGAPGYAPMAALLAGGVTALVGKFCVGLVEDTADTLYMCYCIDRDVGEMHQEEVFSAFEWQTPGRGQERPHGRPHIPGRPPQPPMIRARSPSPYQPSSEPSDEDIPMKQSTEQTQHAPRSAVRNPVHPLLESSRDLEESQGSEGSMMLGLDFV